MKINKLYKFFTLLCLTMFCFSNFTMAQTNGTEVTVTVIDEQGSPISNVNVFKANGDKVSSNSKGQFKITLEDQEESVSLEKKGYKTLILTLADLANESYTSLLALRNFGQKSAEEVIDALQKRLGINLPKEKTVKTN